jgi:hypothetical protein
VNKLKIFQLWDNTWSCDAKDSSFSSWVPCTIFCFSISCFATFMKFICFQNFQVYNLFFASLVSSMDSQVECIVFWLEKNPFRFESLNFYFCLSGKCHGLFRFWFGLVKFCVCILETKFSRFVILILCCCCRY